jgi:predicted ribosomally synthesized peptide with nif11-like leader
MSEEQLSALLAKLKDDAGLLEKFKSAEDLDAALEIAQEAGFDVSKEDCLRFQATQLVDLSDEELENVTGGTGPMLYGVIGAMAVAAGGAMVYASQNAKSCW